MRAFALRLETNVCGEMLEDNFTVFEKNFAQGG
jgi:hypothetical protein